MQKNTKLIISLLFILFLPGRSFSQNFFDGINVGIKVGGSQFLGESGHTISGRVIEFNNTYGFCYDLEFSKYITNHIEFGFELGTSKLFGETDDPQFQPKDFTVR